MGRCAQQNIWIWRTSYSYFGTVKEVYILLKNLLRTKKKITKQFEIHLQSIVLQFRKICLSKNIVEYGKRLPIWSCSMLIFMLYADFITSKVTINIVLDTYFRPSSRSRAMKALCKQQIVWLCTLPIEGNFWYCRVTWCLLSMVHASTDTTRKTRGICFVNFHELKMGFHVVKFLSNIKFTFLQTFLCRFYVNRHWHWEAVYHFIFYILSFIFTYSTHRKMKRVKYQYFVFRIFITFENPWFL